MKKLFTFIVAMAMVSCFAGCGESKNDKEISASNSETVEKDTKSTIGTTGVDINDIFDDVYENDFYSFACSSEWEIGMKDDIRCITISSDLTLELWGIPTELHYYDDNKAFAEYWVADARETEPKSDCEVCFFGENCFAKGTFDDSIYYVCQQADKLEFFEFNREPKTYEEETIISHLLSSIDFKEIEVLSEEEYKANCQLIPYEKIARDSNGLAGEYVNFTGEVIQVVEDGVYRVNVTLDGAYYTDTILVHYDIGDRDRILEDDIITIWGQSGGLYTYETVIGDSVTVPLVYAGYAELVQ